MTTAMWVAYLVGCTVSLRFIVRWTDAYVRREWPRLYAGKPLDGGDITLALYLAAVWPMGLPLCAVLSGRIRVAGRGAPFLRAVRRWAGVR